MSTPGNGKDPQKRNSVSGTPTGSASHAPPPVRVIGRMGTGGLPRRPSTPHHSIAGAGAGRDSQSSGETYQPRYSAIAAALMARSSGGIEGTAGFYNARTAQARLAASSHLPPIQSAALQRLAELKEVEKAKEAEIREKEKASEVDSVVPSSGSVSDAPVTLPSLEDVDGQLQDIHANLTPSMLGLETTVKGATTLLQLKDPRLAQSLRRRASAIYEGPGGAGASAASDGVSEAQSQHDKKEREKEKEEREKEEDGDALLPEESDSVANRMVNRGKQKIWKGDGPGHLEGPGSRRSPSPSPGMTQEELLKLVSQGTRPSVSGSGVDEFSERQRQRQRGRAPSHTESAFNRSRQGRQRESVADALAMADALDAQVSASKSPAVAGTPVASGQNGAGVGAGAGIHAIPASAKPKVEGSTSFLGRFANFQTLNKMRNAEKSKPKEKPKEKAKDKSKKEAKHEFFGRDGKKLTAPPAPHDPLGRPVTFTDETLTHRSTGSVFGGGEIPTHRREPSSPTAIAQREQRKQREEDEETRARYAASAREAGGSESHTESAAVGAGGVSPRPTTSAGTRFFVEYEEQQNAFFGSLINSIAVAQQQRREEDEANKGATTKPASGQKR